MTATPASSDYHFSEQIGHLLRRAYQRHVLIFQEVVPDAKLSAAQFVVLCSVRDTQSCEVAAVVQATAIDEPSVRAIVERLKWSGLLSVAHEPGDTRGMTMQLTPAGMQVIEQTVPFARQISERTFGDLEPDERETLIALLRRISGLSAV